MRCEDVAVALSESSDAATPLPDVAKRHVERCLRCQVEQVQYRRVHRALANMRGFMVEPTPGLFTEIMALIESGVDEEPKGLSQDLRRVAYVAAATAATAATAAGAIVLASRSKRPAS